jgi:hypothetical protein
MNATKKTARVAGLLYLLMVFTGLFCLMYVPGKLIVQGHATETANNILAHQSLFRINLVVGLFSVVFFTSVALALYQLLKDVSRQLATLMVILVLISIPQSFVSLLLQYGALELVRGTDFLSVIDKPQRDVWAMLCLHLDHKGTVFVELFWGLWLFPLGLLVFRSGFLPRILGVWLIINGAAYVTMCLTGLLLPQHAGTVYKFALPALLGEVALMLWLLIMGIRPAPLADSE